MCVSIAFLIEPPNSIFLPNEPIFLRLKDGRVRKAGFLTGRPPTPPSGGIVSGSFGREAGRALRAGIRATQAALFATTREAKEKRVKAARYKHSGLMTRADDESSGRSCMMRKSHIRFPEKGVATHWSFDQPPPPVNSALGSP